MSKNIEFKGQDMITRAFVAELKSKYPNIMNALGSGANDILNGLRKLLNPRNPIHDKVPKY